MSDTVTQLETQVAALTEQLRDARTLVGDQQQTIWSLQMELNAARQSEAKAHQSLAVHRNEKHNAGWWGNNAERMAFVLKDIFGDLTKAEAMERLCGKSRKVRRSVNPRDFERAWNDRETYLRALQKAKPLYSRGGTHITRLEAEDAPRDPDPA